MVPRKSKHGIFWGCANYPKCDGTRNSEGEAPRHDDEDENEAPPQKRPRWMDS